MIVEKSDFIGEYFIAQDVYSTLDVTIEKYEKYYLLRLLGAELYDLFIADLTATTPQIPNDADFLLIFNSFQIDDNGQLCISEGIRKMLVQFIYFHYTRDTQYNNTVVGTVRNNAELGTMINPNGNLYKSYNEGVDNATNIQMYIVSNLDKYETFNGVPFCYSGLI